VRLKLALVLVYLAQNVTSMGKIRRSLNHFLADRHEKLFVGLKENDCYFSGLNLRATFS
jgi:hypothetical protein